jgi:Mrp family chromosome partitioning ATPase
VKHLKNSGLDLLPGKKSLKAATNLVNSPAMGRLLKEAAKSYDIVIVDTPPMALAPDAECICEFADAALLVVRQNAATANDLNDAAALLGKSTHLLGCVLNNVYGSGNFSPVFRYGSYGKYDKYDKYGRYGKYGYGSRE